MRYRVIGGKRETGEDVDFIIEAADVAAVELYARRKNILISSVKPEAVTKPKEPPKSIFGDPEWQSVQTKLKSSQPLPTPVPLPPVPPSLAPVPPLFPPIAPQPPPVVSQQPPPKPARKVKLVTEVKATCSGCGNVWYYKPGEGFRDWTRKVDPGASLKARCPRCHSTAISREKLTHEVVLPTNPHKPAKGFKSDPLSRWLATQSPTIKGMFAVLIILLVISPCIISAVVKHIYYPHEDESRNVPSPTQPTIPSDVLYTTIKSEIQPNVDKFDKSINIQINKIVSEDVLRSIAMKLKTADSRQYENIFITYYLPYAAPGDGSVAEGLRAWAVTNFKSDYLKVSIYGFTIEEAARII